MYGREYGDRVLRFEPSGGLLHWTLVMRDKETDSYWSIMTGDALSGELEGTPLRELPLGEKVRWRDWLARHPGTLVLSVDGVQHVESNRYADYLASAEGVRGAEADDDRLPTKAPIFSFRLGGRPYAVPFAAFEGGGAFRAGERRVFLYRPPGAEILDSTVAFVATRGRFKRRGGAWTHLPSGARFDAGAGRFLGDAGALEPLAGFDTFWFNWSMTHPDTVVLGGR